MAQPPPPERKNRSEESLATELTPMNKFKKLTNGLLSVSRKELAERERLWAKENETKEG
jgi:hypothetical protein